MARASVLLPLLARTAAVAARVMARRGLTRVDQMFRTGALRPARSKSERFSYSQVMKSVAGWNCLAGVDGILALIEHPPGDLFKSPSRDLL